MYIGIMIGNMSSYISFALFKKYSYLEIIDSLSWFNAVV